MTRFVEDLLERRTFPAAHYDLLFNGTFRKGKACRSFGFDLGENRPERFIIPASPDSSCALIPSCRSPVWC